MNSFLKALIQELYDLEQAGEKALAKQWSALVSAAIKAGMDLPALISSVSAADADLKALLADPKADADLLAFVVGLVGHQTKAEAIVVAAADLVLSATPKVGALVAAIQLPADAPAPAPAA